jgi:hypothetical protein
MVSSKSSAYVASHMKPLTVRCRVHGVRKGQQMTMSQIEQSPSPPLAVSRSPFRCRDRNDHEQTMARQEQEQRRIEREERERQGWDD